MNYSWSQYWRIVLSFALAVRICFFLKFCSVAGFISLNIRVLLTSRLWFFSYYFFFFSNFFPSPLYFYHFFLYPFLFSFSIAFWLFLFRFFFFFLPTLSLSHDDLLSLAEFSLTLFLSLPLSLRVSLSFFSLCLPSLKILSFPSHSFRFVSFFLSLSLYPFTFLSLFPSVFFYRVCFLFFLFSTLSISHWQLAYFIFSPSLFTPHHHHRSLFLD